MSPYLEAFNWIRGPGYTTGSAASLARLTLSLYNEQCGFSFAECVGNLDDKLTALAVAMCAHYAEHGEDEELRQIGRQLVDQYPRLWEQGVQMAAVRAELRRQWEREDYEADQQEAEGEDHGG